jgi:hypothetical protein
VQYYDTVVSPLSFSGRSLINREHRSGTEKNIRGTWDKSEYFRLLASFIGNIPTISEKVIWCFDTRNPEVPIFTGLVVPKDEKKCVGQWDMGQAVPVNLYKHRV